MKGWEKFELQEIGKIVGGGTPSTKDEKFWNGTIPWLTPYDLSKSSSKYVSNGERYISNEGLNKSGARLLPKNTVLFTSRAPIGYKAIAQNGICTNQGFQSIIVNPEIADFNFIYYLLEINLEGIKGIASGATFPEISNSKLKKYKVLLPNLPTQRKIAYILSTYDDLIENNLKRIKLLEELAQRTYEEWFVKFRVNGVQLEVSAETGLPEGWGRKKLVEVANLTMGQSPKSEFYNKNAIGIPFHQGVSDYGFRFPINSTWSTNGNRFAEKGDILFSVRAPVGRLNVAIEKIILGRGLSSINHKNNFTSGLFYQLQKIFFKDDLMGGGAIFNSVTKSDVERIEVIEANNGIMVAFNSFTISIDKQIETLTMQNRLLKESRDILLPRLMSGKIEVQGLREEELAIAAEPETIYKSR